MNYSSSIIHYPLWLVLLCTMPAALWAQNDDDLAPATIEVVRAYDPSLPDAPKINLMPRIATDTTNLALPQITYTLRNIKPLSEGYLLASIPPAKVQREPATAPEKLQGYLRLGLGYNLSTLFDGEVGGSSASGLSWLLYANHYGNYGDITNERSDKVPTLDIHNDIGVGMRKPFVGGNTLTVNANFAPQFVHYYGYNADSFLLKDYEKLGNDSISQRYLKTRIDIDFTGKSNDWNYGIALQGYNFNAKNHRTENEVELHLFADKAVDTFLTVGASLEVEGFFRTATLADDNHLHFALAPYGSYRRDWWEATANLNLTVDAHHNVQTFFFPTLTFTAALLDGIICPYFETNGRYIHNSFVDIASVNPYISPFDTLNLHETRSYNFVLGIKGRYRSRISYRVWADYAILKNDRFFYNTADVMGAYFNLFYDNGARFSGNAELTLAISQSFTLNAAYCYQRYYLDSLQQPLHKPQHTLSVQARYNLWNKLVLSAGLDVYGGYYALDLYKDKYAQHSAGYILNANVEYRFFNNSSAFLHLNNILGSRYQPLNNYNMYGFGVMVGYGLKF